jgi:hypothetical protein
MSPARDRSVSTALAAKAERSHPNSFTEPEVAFQPRAFVSKSALPPIWHSKPGACPGFIPSRLRPVPIPNSSIAPSQLQKLCNRTIFQTTSRASMNSNTHAPSGHWLRPGHLRTRRTLAKMPLVRLPPIRSRSSCRNFRSPRYHPHLPGGFTASLPQGATKEARSLSLRKTAERPFPRLITWQMAPSY